MKILKRHLDAVNMDKLQSDSLDKLVEFVRESFKIHWKSRDLSAIKNLDYITKGLTIPSRSDLNIANGLMVYILLLFDIFTISLQYFYNLIKFYIFCQL